jgi:hypothetical protein
MSKVNWDEAPVWATAYGQTVAGGVWVGDTKYQYLTDGQCFSFSDDGSNAFALHEIKIIEYRPVNNSVVPDLLEEAYNNLINKFKEDVLEIVDAHVSKLHTDFAPHLQQDTDYNVSYIASTLVNKLVRGDFERHNETSVVVKDDNGIGTYIRLTSHQYDSLRKNLIEVMPECPKDLEIESLKEQLKHAYGRNY